MRSWNVLPTPNEMDDFQGVACGEPLGSEMLAWDDDLVALDHYLAAVEAHLLEQALHRATCDDVSWLPIDNNVHSQFAPFSIQHSGLPPAAV